MQTLKFNDTETTTGYEKLEHVLISAYKQAASGKGHIRHNLSGGTPFHEQRMQTISQMIDSPLGMVFQACKKITEGIDLPTHEARVNEMLGAINYLAGIVIYLNKTENAKFANNMNFATGGVASAAPTTGFVGDNCGNVKSEFVVPTKKVPAEELPITRLALAQAATAYKDQFGSRSAREVVKMFHHDGKIADVPEDRVAALTKIFRVLVEENVDV